MFYRLGKIKPEKPYWVEGGNHPPALVVRPRVKLTATRPDVFMFLE